MKSTLLLLALTSVINGATVIAKLESVSPSLTITGSNGSGQTSIWSGQLNFDKFQAFCVETTQTINLGEAVTYTSSSYWDKSGGEAVARIVSMYLHGVQTPLEAASAQWAIWETLSADSGSLLTGSVRMSAGQTAVAARASEYLSQSASYSPANVAFMESPTRQDMVSYSVSSIPEVTPNGALAVVIIIGTLTYRRR